MLSSPRMVPVTSVSEEHNCLPLHFYPEECGSIPLRNVATHRLDYTALSASPMQPASFQRSENAPVSIRWNECGLEIARLVVSFHVQ
jgi:hypothetical protein